MACNCVEEVNLKLAESNTRLSQAMVLSENQSNPWLMIQTEQIEKARGTKKAATMFLSCCPFCGVRYEPKKEAST